MSASEHGGEHLITEIYRIGSDMFYDLALEGVHDKLGGAVPTIAFG